MGLFLLGVSVMTVGLKALAGSGLTPRYAPASTAVTALRSESDERMTKLLGLHDEKEHQTARE